MKHDTNIIKTEAISDNPAFFPNLKTVFSNMARDQRADVLAWMLKPEGLEIGTTKAMSIMRGVFTGSTAERRALAAYLGQSEAILFDQSQKP